MAARGLCALRQFQSHRNRSLVSSDEEGPQITECILVSARRRAQLLLRLFREPAQPPLNHLRARRNAALGDVIDKRQQSLDQDDLFKFAQGRGPPREQHSFQGEARCHSTTMPCDSRESKRRRPV